MDIQTLHDQARNGDALAEKRLFEALAVRFGLFAKRRIQSIEDSEEVVQEALLAIARKYKQIEFRVSFAAWAHKVLNNEILVYYRRKAGREAKFSRLPDADIVADWQIDPAFREQLLYCLKRVGRSNRRYARILNLYYQGYSTEEVCTKLGLTPNHCYVALWRARSLLEICLDKGDMD